MEDNFSFENAYATYSYQDGILYIEFKPQQIIDLEVVRSLVTDRIAMANTSVVPVMIVIKDDYLILDTAAIRYLLRDAGKEKSAAQAVVLKNNWLRWKLNLLGTNRKSKVKGKLFGRRSAAKLWLMEYLNFSLD